MVDSLVPFFKFLHILALSLWCGGLLAMPLMMSRQVRTITLDNYRRIRKSTHLTYTLLVTPAAVAAVISGTWLIFMRGTFHPWFYAKLAFVAALVGAHVWIGQILVAAAETSRDTNPPRPHLPLLAVCLSIVGVLFLVLAKPDLSWIQFPSWLAEPMDRPLPFDVPRL